MHPIREPVRSGLLQVSAIYQIYWEESGNPDGIPVIFLHGGPGAGASPACRGFFNPEKYRIVIIDQRGCGRSLPYAELENAARRRLEENGWTVDYVEVRRADTLETAHAGDKHLVVLAAARLGATRLIDNVEICLD